MAIFTKYDPDQLNQFVDEAPLPTVYREIAGLEAYLKTNKKDHEAHYALALFLIRLKQNAKAMEHLDAAHKLQRSSQVILRALAEITINEANNYKRGLIYLKRLSQMVDNKVQAYIEMAKCHIHLHQADEALAILEKAERKAPNTAAIYVSKADAYQLTGDADAAEAALQRARELGARAQFGGNLARAGKESNIEEILSELERLKDHDSVGGLHNAAAEYYDKAGDFDKAFEHYKACNENSKGKYTQEQLLTGFRNVREAFNPSFYLSHKHLGTSFDKFIFIVGMPRSGTTLTEAILAAHPQIEDRGEIGFGGDFQMLHGMFEEVPESLRSMQDSFARKMSKLPDQEFRALLQVYFNKMGVVKDQQVMLVDKMPHNFLTVGLIATMFPKSKVIFCRRHPMDVSLSCYKQNFNEYHQSYCSDLKTLGLYYYQFWKLMEYWKDTAPIEIHDIFYEDLVQNTELVARGMIEHVGLEWDPACLDHTKTQKTVATASAWQVRQPVYTDSMMKWKKYGDNLKPLETILAPLNKQYEEELGAKSK